MKVSKKQVLDTAQLSTREAAKVLGVGKSSVQRARNKYANEGKPKTDNGLTDPMTLDETLAYLDSAEDETMPSASTGSSETHVTIEDDLEADGVTNGSHRLSYAYSEWDMPDGRVGRSRRVTAVLYSKEYVNRVPERLYLSRLVLQHSSSASTTGSTERKHAKVRLRIPFVSSREPLRRRSKES